MTCHWTLFNDAPVLAPLRRRYAGGTPLVWNRVHDLPDFVYFDHGIHVAKGVGCSTCHGRVDQMPLMRRVASLDMQWCLECHRDPEPYLRAPGADLRHALAAACRPARARRRASQALCTALDARADRLLDVPSVKR